MELNNCETSLNFSNGRNHRSMVRRLLPSPGFFINQASTALFLKRFTEKDVIDAQAGISSKTHHAIVPPAKGFWWLLKHSKRIR